MGRSDDIGATLIETLPETSPVDMRTSVPAGSCASSAWAAAASQTRGAGRCRAAKTVHRYTEHTGAAPVCGPIDVRQQAKICYRCRNMQVQARLLIAAEELDRERDPGSVAAFSLRLDLPSREPLVRQQTKLTHREQTWRDLSAEMEEFLREALCYPPGRRRPLQKALPAGPTAIETEINSLYREVRRLIPLAATDPQAELAYHDALRRLRDLEEREAERWSARFNAKRALPPGEGYAALRRADELIAKYADLASANRTAEDAAHQTPPTKGSE